LSDWNGDPGAGWDVAGVSSGTKDHTIVRKADVTAGNDGMWEFSAGTDTDDSEWVVLDQNDWTYLGSHPHEFSTCDDADADDICDDEDDCVGECDTCGVCNGDGMTSCWDGTEVCDVSDCPDECAYNGDANGDGVVNVTDVVLIVMMILYVLMKYAMMVLIMMMIPILIVMILIVVMMRCAIQEKQVHVLSMDVER
jgi:hypothetical protein